MRADQKSRHSVKSAERPQTPSSQKGIAIERVEPFDSDESDNDDFKRNRFARNININIQQSQIENFNQIEVNAMRSNSLLMPPSNHYQSFINKNSFEGFGLISFPRFSAVNSQIEQIDGKSAHLNRKGSAIISNNNDNNQTNTANMSVISSGNEDDFKMEYL